MAFSLYAAVVPSYRQILEAVSGLLVKAESFCTEKGIAPPQLIQACLAADMLQVVRRLMPMRAIGAVLFVVAVVAVGAVHQGFGDLPDSVHVDEEERDDGQADPRGRRLEHGSGPYDDDRVARRLAEEEPQQRAGAHDVSPSSRSSSLANFTALNFSLPAVISLSSATSLRVLPTIDRASNSRPSASLTRIFPARRTT